MSVKLEYYQYQKCPECKGRDLVWKIVSDIKITAMCNKCGQNTFANDFKIYLDRRAIKRDIARLQKFLDEANNGK